MGSTHVESQLKDPTGASKKVQNSTLRDMQPRRRMDSDQTVFKVYKGVKTFDFCKEKNVIVTGGKSYKFMPALIHFNLLIQCLKFLAWKYFLGVYVLLCLVLSWANQKNIWRRLQLKIRNSGWKMLGAFAKN